MTRIAIPLFGKMAARSYHSPQLREEFANAGLSPRYFVSQDYFEDGKLSRQEYAELRVGEYQRFVKSKPWLAFLQDVRRFGVRTETTDLRFRERLEGFLYGTAPVAKAWLYGAGMDLARHVPRSPHLAMLLEELAFCPRAHDQELVADGVAAVLTPSMGGYGFQNECFFAREAKRRGIPCFASITNYDNLVNMGYRGYTPISVAVWSKAMADDAIRFQGLRASQIEITGSVQFDRYIHPVGTTRDAYLKSKGLDPRRKTVLWAGGVNAQRYYEIYELFTKTGPAELREANLVIRPYPHEKLLAAPSWRVLEGLFEKRAHTHLSHSLGGSGDIASIRNSRNDLTRGEDTDELHALLKFSDVMINVFSTISLEAALCDLPAIHLGYDEFTFGLRYPVLTEFQQRQTHNRREKRLAAARIAKSERELIDSLLSYLARPDQDRDARADYARFELGELDGRASARLVQMIRSQMRS